MDFLTVDPTQAGGGLMSTLMFIVPILLMFVLFYFLMIRPQKKKEKEIKNMRDSIVVGDEITTIGGIVGRVVTIKDDTITIETSADRSKIKFMRWAIQGKENVVEG